MELEKCQSRRLSDYGGTLSITSYMVIAPHKMVELGRMSDYRGSMYAHNIEFKPFLHY